MTISRCKESSDGVNGMQQSSRNKGVEVLIPEYDLFDIGAFLFTQKRFDKLTLSGGIRFDNRAVDSKLFTDAGNIKFNAFNKNFSNVSGSAGMSYEASKRTTLKLNIARGFRAPSIPELTSNGAHEGANLFYNSIHNFIYYRKLSAVGGGDSIIVDGNNQFFAFRFNQDNAKLYGAEVMLTYTRTRWTGSHREYVFLCAGCVEPGAGWQ